MCRPQDDAADDVVVVIFQVEVDAEAGTQGGGEQSAARGGTHEGEGVEVVLVAPCRWAVVDLDVDAFVVDGRVEIFLDDGREPVYLVDEEHVVRFQGGEQTRQVAGFVEHRSRGHLEAHAQFVGDDVAQGGFPQSGRSVQQRVVERLSAQACRLDKHLQIVHDLVLPAEVAELQRAERVLKLALTVVVLLAAYVEVFFHNHPYSSPGCCAEVVLRRESRNHASLQSGGFI